MTAVMTAARQAVITSLSGVSATVYDTPPTVPIPPAVVVLPDTPWFTPATIGNRLRGELKLRAMCVTRDGQGGLDAMETLVESVLAALPSGAMVEDATQPASTDIGAQGSVLVSEIRFRLHIKES
jgi:hypothetical protein